MALFIYKRLQQKLDIIYSDLFGMKRHNTFAASCFLYASHVYRCLILFTFVSSNIYRALRYGKCFNNTAHLISKSVAFRIACKHLIQINAVAVLSFVVVVVVEFLNPFSNIFKDIRLPSFCFIMFYAQINRIKAAAANNFRCVLISFRWHVLKCKRASIFHALIQCGLTRWMWIYFSQHFPTFRLNLNDWNKWTRNGS